MVMMMIPHLVTGGVLPEGLAVQEEGASPGPNWFSLSLSLSGPWDLLSKLVVHHIRVCVCVFCLLSETDEQYNPLSLTPALLSYLQPSPLLITYIQNKALFYNM